MAKAILDATKTILFEDDMEIDHLNLIKIQQGTEDYIVINIRKSKLNQHRDVIFKTLAHGWAGQKLLDLKDFMD